MDNQSTPNGIWAKDRRTLRSLGQLDKLDWFIAKLKDHGIYADLNLHVSRNYPDRPESEKDRECELRQRRGQFLGGHDRRAKGVRARAALPRECVHGGIRTSEEPVAVALIEINNENALLFEWQNGGLDKIAAPYRAELSGLWTDWLKTSYGSDDRLRAAWSAGARPGGANLLKNSDFQRGLDGWTLEKHEGAEATAEAACADGVSAPWRVAVDASLQAKAVARADRARRTECAARRIVHP